MFGAVFAAAVILDPARPVRGLDDSKALTPSRREVLAARIWERAIAVAIGTVDPFTIDRINIYQAARLALLRAVTGLVPAADFVYVDGPLTLDLAVPQQALIRGDARCASIAAASIVAKVARDASLAAWSRVYPEFALESNKGYGAPDHLAGLAAAGPSPHHRYSFEPVRRAAGLGQGRLFS